MLETTREGAVYRTMSDEDRAAWWWQALLGDKGYDKGAWSFAEMIRWEF